MMRPLGHLPDLPDPRDARHPVEQLVGAGDVLPATDWRAHVPVIVDQEGEDCVGEGWARMLHMRASISGRPILWPSAYSIWTPARQRGGFFPANSGVRPRDAAECLREWGLCAEHRWPSRRSNIEHELPWDVLQAGADARVSQYSRLLTAGPERCVEIRRALSSGFPVGFAMRVDQAFEDGPGLLWTGMRGALRGGHYMVLVGHRPGAFLCLNSWGPTWNGDGYVWIADDCIGSAECSDFYVAEVAPEAVT